MNHEATHYDRDSLQRLLEDALPEPAAGEIVAHIGDCAACRGLLELLAAQPEWWSQACSGVKEILSDPDSYLSSKGEIRSLSESLSSVVSDDSFTNDFAVDFLEPSDDPAMLGRLGEYEILEVIGRGGMGVVLKGFQRELNRYVAVKVLAPHLALSAAARKRFAREAQATAAVVHPHVMAIHAVTANAKLPYLVMPFVACESLQQRLDRQGPMDVKDVLRIGLQAASGLAAAHAQGLVHRDVKPANILLEITVDRVMLTDFGLARAVDDATLTRTGIIAGTPQYMSPEQANGDMVDHRSDLFSLGSVLYAMCTGRPPFRAETTFGVLRRIRETSPRPIREVNDEIPVWLERITLKLLSKGPENRITSATEVATVLEQCLAHVQQPASVALPDAINGWELVPIPDTHPPKSSKRFRPLALWTTVAVAALILIFTIANRPKSGALPIEQHETAESESDSVTSDSLLQWDSVQSEIDATGSALEPLEAESQNDLEDAKNNQQSSE